MEAEWAQQGILGSKAQKVPGMRGLLIPTIRILVVNSELQAQCWGNALRPLGGSLQRSVTTPDTEGIWAQSFSSSAALALAWLHRTLLCSFVGEIFKMCVLILFLYWGVTCIFCFSLIHVFLLLNRVGFRDAGIYKWGPIKDVTHPGECSIHPSVLPELWQGADWAEIQANGILWWGDISLLLSCRVWFGRLCSAAEDFQQDSGICLSERWFWARVQVGWSEGETGYSWGETWRSKL